MFVFVGALSHKTQTEQYILLLEQQYEHVSVARDYAVHKTMLHGKKMVVQIRKLKINNYYST